MTVAVRPALQVYSTGSVTGTAGSAVVAGVGTAWTSIDPTTGASVGNVASGDLFITTSGPIPILSVDSDTQITLESPLQVAIAAGSAYRIRKVVANYSGPVLNQIVGLLAQGSDAQPDLSRTIDNSGTRAKLRIASNGDAQIAVGPSGAADSALTTAIDITQGGVVNLPNGLASIGGGPLAGLRNLIINGNFAINQRAYASGGTLASVTFGHDRWKAWYQACTYTFTQSVTDTLITLTSGQLGQVIEASAITAGTYTLSWNGTATVQVDYEGPSAPVLAAQGSSPLTFTLPDGNTLPYGGFNVHFYAGSGSTVGNVQLERGAVKTQFERRHTGLELALCQRYYFTSYVNVPAGTANTYVNWVLTGLPSPSYYAQMNDVCFPTTMRASPTLKIYSPATGASGYIHVQNANVDVPCYVGSLGPDRFNAAVNNTNVSADILSCHFTADAEL